MLLNGSEVDCPMKRFRKKRNGSAHLFVIGALLIVSVFSAFIINLLQTDTYQLHAYSLQMQAYYLADEAASATVSALLADDDASLLQTGAFPMSDTMTHTASGTELGVSEIHMTKETHSYYEEDKEWIVIRITTTIPDNRAERAGESFSYKMTVMVLVENPLVQLYNINPDDL